MSKSFNHLRKEFAELLEKVDATKEIGKGIDRMYDEAGKRTQYVSLKDIDFKKSVRVKRKEPRDNDGDKD